MQRWHLVVTREPCYSPPASVAGPGQLGQGGGVAPQAMDEYGKTKDSGRARHTYSRPLIVIPILAIAIVIAVPAMFGRGGLQANTNKMVRAKYWEIPFMPGVPGRSSGEVCNTASKACQQWTALAVGCEEDMKLWYTAYLRKFLRNYCDEAEALREKLTDVENSSDPGAYDF